MKTLRAFRSETNSIDEAASSLTFKMDPPNILLLKRKAIRIFPDGTKVALYHADKIDKYISIPYSQFSDKGVIQVHEQQEVQDNKGNISELEKIAHSEKSGLLTFDDNNQQKVDPMTAQAIVNVYNKVNSSNRSKIEQMVDKDIHNFAKVAAFAHGAHSLGK